MTDAWRQEQRTISWWPHRTASRLTRLVTTSPEELEHWFAHPLLGATQKSELPGWSACTCNGPRSSANVTSLAAFVVDADGVDVTLADAVAGLPCSAIGHTSASHGVKPGNRWRIVLWTDREMTPAEYRAAWPVVVDLFAGLGVALDRSCSDLARLWYVPLAAPQYQHATNGREPVSVSELLELVEAPTVRPSEQRGRGAERASHTAPVGDRVARYLEHVEPAFQGSNGSTATLNAACKIVRLFGLDAHAAFDALAQHWDHRCSPPWCATGKGRRELLRKCQEAERIVRGGVAS